MKARMTPQNKKARESSKIEDDRQEKRQHTGLKNIHDIGLSMFVSIIDQLRTLLSTAGIGLWLSGSVSMHHLRVQPRASVPFHGLCFMKPIIQPFQATTSIQHVGSRPHLRVAYVWRVLAVASKIDISVNQYATLSRVEEFLEA